MMRIYLIIICLLVFSGLYSQTPEITTLAPVQTSFCAGGNILVQYETTGTFSWNCIFTAQLSDMWGNFSNPVTIGSMPLNAGVIPATIPSNTTFGFNYRVRVVSSNPYVIGSVSPMPPLVITSTAVTATIMVSPDDTICSGDTVELYATPNESYVWSNGATTQTVNITQSGIYNVTVTNYFTGCEVTSDSIRVVVHPLPDVNLGADTGICDGDVLVLDAGTGYVNYNWNSGVSSAHEFYVHDPGVYVVQVKDTNDCINWDTVEVAVYSLPEVNLGNDTSFCGNLFYLDAGAGFIAYNWNNGLSLNQVLQVVAPGTYMVEATDTNQCKARDSIEVNIMFVPEVSLGNDLIVCGTSLTLDAGGGFDSYDWNDGTGSQQYFTATQSGLYFVLVVDSNDCKVSDTISITLNHPPYLNLGPDTGCIPGPVFLLDAGFGHQSYYWNDASIDQHMVVNTGMLGPGVYTFWVVVGDANNCFNTDTVTIVVDTHYSIDDFSVVTNPPVFPNPFSDKATIETGMLSISDISFFDASGRSVAFEAKIDSGKIELKAGQNVPGLYYFTVQNGGVVSGQGRFVIVP